MMYVKIHKSERTTIVAVCDEDLIGKKFEEKNLVLDVNQRFYNGEKMNEGSLIPLLKNADSVNIVGKNSIKVAVKAGVIDKDSVIKIKGIPHVMSF